MVAAAVARAAGKGEQNAISAEIAGGVVAGRGRQQVSGRPSLVSAPSWQMPVTVCAICSQPARWLNGPSAPKQLIDRHTMPGRTSASSSGAKPMLRHVAWPVALENTSAITHQLSQLAAPVVRLEVQERGALAVARVHDVFVDLRQAVGGDHQNVSAVLGQRAPRDRARPGCGSGRARGCRKAAVGPRERFGVTIGDLDDLDDGLAGQHLAMIRWRAIPRCVRTMPPHARASSIAASRSSASHCRNSLADGLGLEFAAKHLLARALAGWAGRSAAGTSGHPWSATAACTGSCVHGRG